MSRTPPQQTDPDGTGVFVPVVWRRHKTARNTNLRIDPRAGTVVVTLPLRGTRHSGLALLREHATWVRARLAALPQSVPFANGVHIPVCDIPHEIRHMGAKAPTRMLPGVIEVGGDRAFLARRVADLLRHEAQIRLGSIAQHKASAGQIKPRRVTVKDTRSRWGSCAPDRTLAFSWRLLMAPDYVQDYVVAHEVAHLQHMNHSPRFWKLAETLSPHRSRADTWLEREGPRLMRYGV